MEAITVWMVERQVVTLCRGEDYGPEQLEPVLVGRTEKYQLKREALAQIAAWLGMDDVEWDLFEKNGRIQAAFSRELTRRKEKPADMSKCWVRWNFREETETVPTAGAVGTV